MRPSDYKKRHVHQVTSPLEKWVSQIIWESFPGKVSRCSGQLENTPQAFSHPALITVAVKEVKDIPYRPPLY